MPCGPPRILVPTIVFVFAGTMWTTSCSACARPRSSSWMGFQEKADRRLNYDLKYLTEGTNADLVETQTLRYYLEGRVQQMMRPGRGGPY